MNHEIEEIFYRRCAEILGATHCYKPWVGRGPNRWNNRNPGNGRFGGFGTIRLHSPTMIHVALRHPCAVNRTCDSTKSVYALLEALASPQ
jgi:hypothetical protein